jgi:hypothetical protein
MQICDRTGFPPLAASESPRFVMDEGEAMEIVNKNVEFFADKAFSSAFGSPAITPTAETIKEITGNSVQN